MRLDGSAQLADPGCTRINRPIVHTIYPPVAEAYFLGVHYLAPAGSGTTPIQAGAAVCAVLLTLLLLYGLPKVGRDRGWPCCGPGAHGGPGGRQQRARGRAGRGPHRGRADHAGPAGALSRSAAGLPPALRRAAGALLALAIWTKVTPVLIAPAVLRRRPVAVIARASPPP